MNPIIKICVHSLKDLQSKPKTCSFAISRSCLRRSNALLRSVRAAVYTFFYHELPSFSQSLLGGKVAYYSSCENRTDSSQKIYRNMSTFGHIRVFHIF